MAITNALINRLFVDVPSVLAATYDNPCDYYIGTLPPLYPIKERRAIEQEDKRWGHQEEQKRARQRLRVDR